jgi:hypothetical protein
VRRAINWALRSLSEFSEPGFRSGKGRAQGQGLTAERREPVCVVVGQAGRGLTARDLAARYCRANKQRMALQPLVTSGLLVIRRRCTRGVAFANSVGSIKALQLTHYLNRPGFVGAVWLVDRLTRLREPLTIHPDRPVPELLVVLPRR